MDTSKNTLLKFANLPAFEKITSKDMYQARSFLVQENKKIEFQTRKRHFKR